MGLVWHLRAASPGSRGVFSLCWAGAGTPAALPAASWRNPIAGPEGAFQCIRPAMPGRFKLDDRVTCVRNNNAMGQRHAGKISKVRRTVRIIDGVAVPIPHRSTRPAHASMLRAGHRGHAGPQLEPQQRLRRVPLLLS